MVVAALMPLLRGVGRSQHVRRPNIVFVVLDTVRRDHTGLSETGHSVTPELDRIAAEGTAFTNAWSNAPWTVPSHASMFTGMLPSEHACTSRHTRLDTGAPTLAELLGDAGYRTAAFYSNPWLSDEATGLLRGFETRAEAGRKGGYTLCTSEHGGRQTLSNISKWLDGAEKDQPLFMFVNFLEAHLPYDPPDDYRRSHLESDGGNTVVSLNWAHEYNAGLRRMTLRDERVLRSLYAGDVNTADRMLSVLTWLLKEHGLYEDTVLIVASDHGENLGDHSFVEHQFCVYETLIAVPLVIRAPGRLPEGVRSEPVMLTDLFATVTDLAGLRVSSPRYSRSLLDDPADERAVISEYAGAQSSLVAHLRSINPDMDPARLTPAYTTVRLGDLRLTVGSDGSEVLHDLSSDPHQLAGTDATDLQSAEVLYALLPGVHAGWLRDPSGVAEMSSSLQARLRSLGYVQ